MRILTNDFDGLETQVALVTTPAGIIAAAVNARNNILGVVGTITPGANVVPSTNQFIEGGVFSFTRDGANFSVQVGQNGVLTLAGNSIDVGSAATVGQNVTIENMVLNSTGVSGAIATRTGTIFPLGTLTIRNNAATTAGRFLVLAPTIVNTDTVIVSGNTITGATAISIQITGNAAPLGSLSVALDGNSITPGAGFTAIFLFGAGGFGATAPTFRASVTNNTLTTTGGGFAASLLLSAGFGTITITGNVSGNTITNTGVGSIAFRALDSVIFQGNISNNVFTADAAAAGFGVMDLQANTIQSLHVLGAVTGNTITNSAGGGATDRTVRLAATGGGGSTVIDGGFVGNTVTVVGAAGIGVATLTGLAVGSVVLGAFNGNTFTNFVGGGAISTNIVGSGVTAISIGGGAVAGTVAALETANGLVPGAITSVAATIITP